MRKYFTNAGREYFSSVEDAFLFGVAVKIYNVGRLGFLVSAQPRFCFSRHRHVFIYSASKTFAHLEEKTLLTDTDKKKILADIGKESEQIEV